MTCDIYKGSDFTLIGQFTDGAYRSVPDPAAATQLKFSQLRLNRNPTRQRDETINDNVLVEKADEVDETPEGQITAIACLRDALFWLTGLFGAPVTEVGDAASATKAGGNTGNGTMGAITTASGVVPGVYQLRITTADTDAGDFTVTAPDGSELGTGTVGVEFDEGGLTFTLSDGATDFIVGDGFDITVEPYTHTFTMTRACKPDALLELKGQRVASPTPDARFRRYVGAMVRDFSWDMMSLQQNFVFNLLMAVQVRPHPTVAFDATPTKLGKSRAMAAKAAAYDVEGASTLGDITGITLSVNLNPGPVALADGLVGYGAVLPGDIMFSGTLTALHRDGGLSQYADEHTSTPLTLYTESERGDASLAVNFPSVEYSEPPDEITGKNGLSRTYNFEAHYADGDDPVTIVLTNNVPYLVAP